MQRRWISSPDYRALIAAIRDERVARDISQRELARRIGKPVSFVNKIELIERRIDVLEFIVVCRALDIPSGEMMERLQALVSEAPEF